MKLKTTFLAFILGTGLAGAQGTFVFDQQSTGLVDGAAFLTSTPFGQSFTPTLDAVGFVELQLFNSAPTTVAVNIRSGSITGSILGTSLPTTMPGNSSGIFDFLFSDSVALTPATQYYFEPVAVGGSGAGTEADITFFQYTGGDAIVSGTTFTDRDFWFREGITVPEPSSPALVALGAGLLLWTLRKQFVT